MYIYFSEHKGRSISDLVMGDFGTVWVVYEDGTVWFTNGVTRNTPKGSGRWWQVKSAIRIKSHTFHN